MPKKVTVVVSGGFDPLHSGHIAYITAAAKLGDRLVVGVNSDAWLMIKKGQAFMPLKERLAVLRAMRCVDEAVSFDDTDGTAVKLIEAVQAMYPKDQIVFANGGDRTSENIPEMAVADAKFVFGVGGTDKKNSSSWDSGRLARTAHRQALGPLRGSARGTGRQGQRACGRAGQVLEPAAP
jgi:cytidyltransferase-like protein